NAANKRRKEEKAAGKSAEEQSLVEQQRTQELQQVKRETGEMDLGERVESRLAATSPPPPPHPTHPRVKQEEGEETTPTVASSVATQDDSVLRYNISEMDRMRDDWVTEIDSVTRRFIELTEQLATRSFRIPDFDRDLLSGQFNVVANIGAATLQLINGLHSGTVDQAMQIAGFSRLAASQMHAMGKRYMNTLENAVANAKSAIHDWPDLEQHFAEQEEEKEPRAKEEEET
ncbi:MAG: hypothetical protein Q9169_008603, partial [Polycauliona sp. 2 TL-2023]